jgi:peroxiredoxin
MTHWHSYPDTETRPSEVWFSLPSSTGRTISLSDYLDRGCLFLLFLPRAVQSRWVPLLAALAAAVPTVADKDAHAVALVALDARGAARLAEDMRLPFPLLVDPDGATLRRFASLLRAVPAEEAPLVFVLDRFGAPRAAAWLDRDDTDDWIGKALAWIDLADLACPE